MAFYVAKEYEFAASYRIGSCQMISSPHPLSTTFSMKRLKPFICSSVIVGGIESSCRETATANGIGDPVGRVAGASIDSLHSGTRQCFD